MFNDEEKEQEGGVSDGAIDEVLEEEDADEESEETPQPEEGDGYNERDWA